MSNPYRHPISTPVSELIGKFSIADSPSPKPQAEAAPGLVEVDRKAIARIEQYIYEYEDAPSWGGPIKYPAPPSLADLRTVLSLALARQHGAREPWQAIESAPKDGTAILLAGYHINHGWIQKTAKAVGDLWYSNGHTVSPDPSHWMPLPAAPATDVGEAV